MHRQDDRAPLPCLAVIVVVLGVFTVRRARLKSGYQREPSCRRSLPLSRYCRLDDLAIALLVLLGGLLGGGCTSMSDAIRTGDNTALAQMLGSGATTGPWNANNATPLHFAVEQGNSEAVTLLLDHGANPNAKKLDGTTPLHIAGDGKYGSPLSRAEVQVAIIQILLDHGSAINALTRAGEVPLSFAALHGTTEAVDLLISRGADVNAGRIQPLVCAVTGGNMETLKHLIAHRADVNVQAVNGATPLDQAVSIRSPEYVAILLDAGAKPNLKVDNRYTTLDKAVSRIHRCRVRGEHTTTIRTVRNDSDPRELVTKTAVGGECPPGEFNDDVAIVRLLLKKGATVDPRALELAAAHEELGEATPVLEILRKAQRQRADALGGNHQTSASAPTKNELQASPR